MKQCNTRPSAAAAISFYLKEIKHENQADYHQHNSRTNVRIDCSLIQPGTYLTYQEYHCLKHILAQKTIAETARLLGLSPRTVEFYFNNIKKRFNTKKKKHVIALFTQQEKTFSDLEQPRKIERH